MTKEEYQNAIDFIHAYLHPTGKSEWEMKKLKYRNMAIEALERERDNDIRPKEHWEDDCGDLKCPYCETRVSDIKVFSPLTKYTNTCWFCPICGADMREG